MANTGKLKKMQKLHVAYFIPSLFTAMGPHTLSFSTVAVQEGIGGSA